MRKLRNIAIALCATFMLAACGGGSPETVAENFQKAILDGDFEKAASYATKATAPLLKSMSSMISAVQIEELKKEISGVKVKIVSSEVKGDEATVSLEAINADGEVDSMDYSLIKEDGSWKVQFTK